MTTQERGAESLLLSGHTVFLLTTQYSRLLARSLRGCGLLEPLVSLPRFHAVALLPWDSTLGRQGVLVHAGWPSSKTIGDCLSASRSLKTSPLSLFEYSLNVDLFMEVVPYVE